MNEPFVIGLTGSIGMGKSTTAKMFADEGIPVWDADAAVHRLYGRGGAAVQPIGALCPEAIIDEAISRDALKSWIARDPSALKHIEAIVHPLVAQDRADFIQSSASNIVLVDVPLLFETGGETRVDTVVVVSAPADVQRARVLDRGTMDEATFETILAKQLPDSEKRARANYVIETLSIDQARAAVRGILAELRKGLTDA